MTYTPKTKAEIAIVGLLRDLIEESKDSIQVQSVEGDDDEFDVNVDVKIFGTEYDLSFRVSNIEEDDDNTYTGRYSIEVSEGVYEVVTSFDSKVANFWMTLLFKKQNME